MSRWRGHASHGRPHGFGAGYGTGAHAPDEIFLIDSSDPRVASMDEAAAAFVRFLYQIAE